MLIIFAKNSIVKELKNSMSANFYFPATTFLNNSIQMLLLFNWSSKFKMLALILGTVQFLIFSLSSCFLRVL